MSWACTACTLVNTADGKFCAACGVEAEAELSEEGEKSHERACRACTFANPNTSVKCEMCDTPLAAPSSSPFLHKKEELLATSEPLQFTSSNIRRRHIDVLAFRAASDSAAIQNGGRPGAPNSNENQSGKKIIDVTPSNPNQPNQEDSDAEWSSSVDASDFLQDDDDMGSDFDSEMVSTVTDRATNDSPPAWGEEEDEIEEFTSDGKAPAASFTVSSGAGSMAAPCSTSAPIPVPSTGLVEVEPTWPLISSHFWSVKQLESLHACSVNFRAFTLEHEEHEKIRKTAAPAGADFDKRRQAREAREARLSNWTPRVTTASSKRQASSGSKRGWKMARAKTQSWKGSAQSSNSKSRAKSSAAIKSET